MVERRVALVVGIADYPGQALRNPVNDANAMTAVLREHGFDVRQVVDCPVNDFDAALDQFKSDLEDADVGLFFFAGHGAQMDDANYLMAKDVSMVSKIAAKRTSVALNEVLRVMNETGVEVKIVILDACRSEPCPQNWARNGMPLGLASVSAPKGTIIGFATSPGEIALDGPVGGNGVYTTALLNHIADKDRPIEAVFKRVRSEVAAVTSGDQTTWEHTSLIGDFYLNMSVAQAVQAYSPTAFADKDFAPGPTTYAERTINALKSYSWYSQNPAVQSLNTETVAGLTLDEAFVIGRNIFQAAAGSSMSARDFLNDFGAKTIGWNEAKTKAILDGVLFEIYFDRTGAARKEIKSGPLEEVFRLRQNAKFRSSFDFVTTCLQEARREVLVPPNSDAEIAVTITNENENDRALLQGIFVNGRDLLPSHLEGSAPDEIAITRRLYKEQFEERLVLMLGVPRAQVTVTYAPPLPANETIMVSMAWGSW